MSNQSLIQNPDGIYTNPLPTSYTVTDEFIDPPSAEKASRVTGVKTADGRKNTQEFFANLDTTPVPIDQNSYDATMGFLISKGFARAAAEPIVKQILAVSYYSKRPVWYWLKELDILPDANEINLKILQILNLTNNGYSFLGIRSNKPANPYVNRLLIK